MLQLVDHVLLAGAHARGYLHGVVAREHGVLDGGQHLQRVGKGGGAALGAAEVMARKAALDAVLQQRLGVRDELLQLLGTALGHEVGRVEVVRQRDGSQLDAALARLGRHGVVDERERPVGGALARLVAVEEVHDRMLRMARQQADMAHGERGAQRGHRIPHARLVQRDDVGVALHHHGYAGRGHGRFRLVHTVEHLRLVEQRSLLRVQVLRLALAHHASAEGDALALRIVDGEHDAVVEAVAQLAPVVRQRHVRLHHLVGLEALRRQVAHQLPVPRRKTELPGLRHLAPQAARAQVAARRRRVGAGVAHELAMVELRGLVADGLEAGLAAAADALAPAALGDVDVRALGQPAHGFGKRQVLGLHDEAEHVAALAAAEAVP